MYILTDSGFQHSISNKQVKNQTVNLFGQKIFLPHSTKQILFDICSSKNYRPQLRICSFAYQIKNLTLNSQTQSITESNEIYNDFQFLFSIKLSLGVQTNTQIGTSSEFSSFEKNQQSNQKLTNKFEIAIDDEDFKLPRIYSPKNISMKLLETVNEDSWEVKSENSPSKTKKYMLNDQEKDWDKIQKRSTSQSLTLQSQSLKKSPMAHLSKNSQKMGLIKLRRAQETEEREQDKKEVRKWGKMEALMEYREFLLLGGMVGIFTAVLSTEFLIF